MMTIYVLIDTNIWRRLVSVAEFSILLKKLEFYVGNRHVILLCPDVLAAEWKKHRENARLGIEKELKPRLQELNRKKL